MLQQYRVANRPMTEPRPGSIVGQVIIGLRALAAHLITECPDSAIECWCLNHMRTKNAIAAYRNRACPDSQVKDAAMHGRTFCEIEHTHSRYDVITTGALDQGDRQVGARQVTFGKDTMLFKRNYKVTGMPGACQGDGLHSSKRWEYFYHFAPFTAASGKQESNNNAEMMSIATALFWRAPGCMEKFG